MLKSNNNSPSNGRGRPVGSTSYIEATLGEIKAVLGNSDCIKVRIDRRWAAAIGIGKSNQAALVIEPEQEALIQVNIE